MNKVATIASKVFLTLLVLSPAPIYFLLIYNDLTNDPNSHEPWVSFFDNPNESVYVSWETEEKSSGKVLYGTSRENLSNETDSELLETNIHHVHVEGLQANTTYYFQAVWDESNSRIGTFTTAPNNASSYKFVMISDTQQPKVGPGHHNKIAELIKGKDYRFINIVGDWVDDADYKFLWNNFFTVASVYTDEIPFAPVVGNHDRINHDGTYFPKYFINSVNQSRDAFYWSYDYGQVHFSMASFTYARDWEFTNETIEWLKYDLANAQDSTFRIVMFHCPIVGAGFFGRSDTLLGQNSHVGYNLTQILLDYNVSATVHGHEHHYERGDIQGMKYFVLGGGGGAMDPGLRPQPETEFMTVAPNYMDVKVKTNQMQFTAIGLDGRTIDQYTITEEENQ